MGTIIKPIITERLTEEAETQNRYGFVVDQKANKLEIKSAVEEMYGVSVRSVNTMNYLGKPKSRYSKSTIMKGRTANYKKAIVTLADGEEIDFYSNV
jgi:large subunit ribosomal protein L23